MRRYLTLLAVMSLACSCTLEDRFEHVECDGEVDYIMSGTNKVTDINDGEYSEYFKRKSCPTSMKCHQVAGKEGHFYCLSCSTGQVAIDGNCYDPLTSNEYCGAEGDENGATDESRIGSNCNEMADTDENTPSMYCAQGKCQCPDSMVLCDDRCISPKTDPEHCGAVVGGNCSSDNIDSENYRGEVCKENRGCVEGVCQGVTCAENECQKGDECLNIDDACGSGCEVCSSLPNVANGHCDEGKCITDLCDLGYYLSKNADTGENECLKNDANHCSSDGSSQFLDCNAEDNLGENAATGRCNNNGRCEIDECRSPYVKLNDQCVLNSVLNCGGTVCSELEGWVSGDCYNTECQAKECGDDYHIYQNACERDTAENCGTRGRNCPANSSCVKKECVCNTNYHEYYNENHDMMCEKNSVDNCGEHGKSCTKKDVEHSTSVTCNENGECIATKCDASLFGLLYQYTLCDGICSDLYTDVANCGSCGHDCRVDAKDNSTEMKCSQKTCQAKSCENGYTACSGTCVELNSDVKHCGSCSNNCTNITGWGSGSCVNGKCKIESCKSGYTMCDGECTTLASAAHCGSCDKTCKTSDIPHSTLTNWCSTKTCTPVLCESGYKVSGNECVPRT